MVLNNARHQGQCNYESMSSNVPKKNKLKASSKHNLAHVSKL